MLFTARTMGTSGISGISQGVLTPKQNRLSWTMSFSTALLAMLNSNAHSNDLWLYSLEIIVYVVPKVTNQEQMSEKGD